MPDPLNPFATAGLDGVAVSGDSIADCCGPKVNRAAETQTGTSSAESAGVAGATRTQRVTVEVTDRPIDGFSMGAGVGAAATNPSQSPPPVDSARATAANAQPGFTQTNQQSAPNGAPQSSSSPTPEAKAQAADSPQTASAKPENRESQAQGATEPKPQQHEKQEAAQDSAAHTSNASEAKAQAAESTHANPESRESKAQNSTAPKTEQQEKQEAAPKESVHPKSERQQHERAQEKVQERDTSRNVAEKVAERESAYGNTSPNRYEQQQDRRDSATKREFAGIAERPEIQPITPTAAVKLSPFLSEVKQITDTVVAISASSTFNASKDLAIVARVFESAVSQATSFSQAPASYVSSWGSSNSVRNSSQPSSQTSWSTQQAAPHYTPSQRISIPSHNHTAYLATQSSSPAALRQPARTVRLNSVETRLVTLAPRISGAAIGAAFRRMSNIVAYSRTAHSRAMELKGVSLPTHRQLRSLGLSTTGVKVLVKLLRRVATVSKTATVRKSPTAVRTQRLGRRINSANAIHKIKPRPNTPRSASFRVKRAQMTQAKGIEKGGMRLTSQTKLNRQIRALTAPQKTKLMSYLLKEIATAQRQGSLGAGAKIARAPLIRPKLIALLTLLRAQRQISATLLNSLLNALGAPPNTRKRRAAKSKAEGSSSQELSAIEQATCDETVELLLELAFTDLETEQSAPKTQAIPEQDTPAVEQQLFYVSNSEGPKWELDVMLLEVDDSEGAKADQSDQPFSSGVNL